MYTNAAAKKKYNEIILNCSYLPHFEEFLKIKMLFLHHNLISPTRCMTKCLYVEL